MPSDNPTLADLAAAAERDAAAGVKPTPGFWRVDVERGRFGQLRYVPPPGPLRVRVEEWIDAPTGVRFWVIRENEFLHTRHEFDSADTCKLFAESLLRRATLALHPAPEPHVAAAVAFARNCLGYITQSESGRPREGWSPDLLHLLRTHGLLAKIGDPLLAHGEPTALGRALLNYGSPVEPATRDAKETPNE